MLLAIDLFCYIEHIISHAEVPTLRQRSSWQT